MKISVSYHTDYDIEVDEATFRKILAEKDGPECGDAINELAVNSDPRIVEMLKHCDGAEIVWCANPFEYDCDTNTITWENEDDDAMYWEN